MRTWHGNARSSPLRSGSTVGTAYGHSTTLWKTGRCSEQASRVQAMENSSKNAEEMLSALTIKYNKTRQAGITTELIEIISGAVALEG